ncbi:MAG: Mobile element protein, partial [uncultured Gemmatimonadaceae bacterium]
AVQGQCRSSSPHPEAAAPGHQLGRVRRQLTSAREPDGLVHGGGDCGLASGAAHDPGRAALVLAPGHRHGADAAGRVPPRLAPDRGADRLHPPPARARARRARPHHPVPPGRDAGGAATPTDRRGGALAGGQHRPAADRARRVAGREARHEGAPVVAQAAPRHGRRHRADRGRGADHERGRRRFPGRAAARPGRGSGGVVHRRRRLRPRGRVRGGGRAVSRGGRRRAAAPGRGAERGGRGRAHAARRPPPVHRRARAHGLAEGLRLQSSRFGRGCRQPLQAGDRRRAALARRPGPGDRGRRRRPRPEPDAGARTPGVRPRRV